mgnify:CR=1 FL=1|tara:strand:+ start:163 stop:399 length:237 start_codon:yes stop_codon:yes gene_type:complete
MVSMVGKSEFSMLHEVRQAQRSIENHQAQQNVEREHQRTHKFQKLLEQQQVALTHSYDRLGERKAVQQAQGSNVDIEV